MEKVLSSLETSREKIIEQREFNQLLLLLYNYLVVCIRDYHCDTFKLRDASLIATKNKETVFEIPDRNRKPTRSFRGEFQTILESDDRLQEHFQLILKTTDETSYRVILDNSDDNKELLIPNDIKAKVQSQFGASSDAYATSTVHAKGQSLKILTDLITPQSDWVMLDVATAAGHTALAFAPNVSKVIATDLTEEMVNKAADMAAQRGLSNVETRTADAEALPFDDDTFDLLTCRIAFHHFPHPQQAVKEFSRVLKPGGVLGFTDNVTVADKAAAQYYNDYEKLRDPSHYWVSSLEELTAMFESGGFKIDTTRQFSKEMEFYDWADRMRVSAADKKTLLEMMRNIPQPLESLFMPRWEDDTMYFSLCEVVLIAHLKQA